MPTSPHPPIAPKSRKHKENAYNLFPPKPTAYRLLGSSTPLETNGPVDHPKKRAQDSPPFPKGLYDLVLDQASCDFALLCEWGIENFCFTSA